MDVKRNLVAPALKTLRGVLVSTNAALTFLGGVSLVSSFMPEITAAFNSVVPSMTPIAGPISLLGTLIASATVGYGTNRVSNKIFGLVTQNPSEGSREVPQNDKKPMSIKSSIVRLFSKPQTKAPAPELTPSYVKQERSFSLDDKGYLVTSNAMPCSKPEKIPPAELTIVHQSMLTNENWNKVIFGGDWITSSYFITASQKEKVSMRQQWAKSTPHESKSEQLKNNHNENITQSETENLKPSFLEVKHTKKAFEI